MSGGDDDLSGGDVVGMVVRMARTAVNIGSMWFRVASLCILYLFVGRKKKVVGVVGMKCNISLYGASFFF